MQFMFEMKKFQARVHINVVFFFKFIEDFSKFINMMIL